MAIPDPSSNCSHGTDLATLASLAVNQTKHRTTTFQYGDRVKSNPLLTDKIYSDDEGQNYVDKSYSFRSLGQFLITPLCLLRHLLSSAIVISAILSFGVYSYYTELNDNTYGVYIGEEVLSDDLSQIIQSSLNDFPEHNDYYSLTNAFEQIFLEIWRLVEKWDNALHGAHIESENLKYQPDRAHIWRHYWRIHTYPTSMDTFKKIARASGEEVEVSFTFMRTMSGKRVVKESIISYLPYSSNYNYSDFFARIRSNNISKEELNKFHEDLKGIVRQLAGDSGIQWSWKDGLIGRPHVEDYLTQGVIGTFSRGEEEVTVSLNYLGDFHIHKELKINTTSRVIHGVSNMVQAPIAILFGRVPPIDLWSWPQPHEARTSFR
jgi:hypothetical protein